MSPEVQNAFIKMMVLNFHEKVHTPPPDGGEAFAEEGGDIVEVVSSFGTRQAALALLDREILQTGQMAIAGVAAAGPQMVGSVTQRFDEIKGPVVEGTEDDTPNYMGVLVQVMNRLAEQKLDSGQREAIEQRIIKASRCSSQTVRYVSVAGLKALDDSVATARLKEMAAGDQYLSSPPPPRAPSYLVRDAARKALTAK